ncbi:DUF4129 domain-containing protein [Microbispora oryzae]|uniref:DUF4129 domain-containing protein n=1 Tax=Microbispora oryzae TaxID=2806554 RepID=UPI0027DDE003|nr:DUF4129 domain-containing protein [Microbispora oryzae]
MTPAAALLPALFAALFAALSAVRPGAPLVAWLAGPGSPVDVGRETARGEAAGELIRAGYQQEPFTDRIRRELAQFLGDLLEGRGGRLSGVISVLVITLVVVVLTVLLLWVLRRMSRDRGDGGDAVFGDGEHTAAEHRAAAERLAAAGSWGDAVRERLRAIARDLEERAIVTPLPGRTATELAAVAGHVLPAHAADLSAAARTFDDVVYGGAPGTREAYLSMTALDERLRTARATVIIDGPAGGSADGAAGGAAGGAARAADVGA